MNSPPPLVSMIFSRLISDIQGRRSVFSPLDQYLRQVTICA